MVRGELDRASEGDASTVRDHRLARALALLFLLASAAPVRADDEGDRAAAPGPAQEGASAVLQVRDDAPEARRYEAVVRLRREPGGAGAAASIVDADRFAGEAKSVAELLTTAPGVAVNEYGGLGQLATVSVRGASADGVKVLLDGLPLNTAAGGGVNLSSIPRQWISSIEIVRGAEGARFGAGALGGVVNVVTRRVSPGEWSGQLSYGSFGTVSAAAEGGAGGARWNSVLALGYDQTDGDFTYLFDDRPAIGGSPLQESVRRNNAGRSGGALAKAFVERGGGRFDAIAQLSAGEHELPGSPGPPDQLTRSDRQEELRGSVVLRHALPLGGPFRVASELSLRHDRLDIRLAIPGASADQRGTAAAAQVALAWTSARHGGEVGARVGGERLAASGLGTARERPELALFASEEVALASGRVRLGPALRWERLGGFSGASAKLGATTLLAGPLSARASSGWTFRAPSFAELFLQQGILAPNPALRPEESFSGDAGLELGGRLGLARLGLFAVLYRDLIVYEPDSFRRFKPFNDGKASARGVEAELASRPLGPAGLSASLAYTFLATETLRGEAAVLGKALPHRARHRLFARLAAGRGPIEAHAEAHHASRQCQDLRNLLPIPETLAFNVGGAVSVARRPDTRLHLDLRNVLGDRTLQDGFGNPLPGRMVMLTVRVAGGKDHAR